MEIRRIKPENSILIVDEKMFLGLEQTAKLTEQEIEDRAKLKMQQYIETAFSPIQLEYRIMGVPDFIRHKVVTEVIHQERSSPYTLPESIKYGIIDDLTKSVESHFEHYREDCANLFNVLNKSTEKKTKRKLIVWKSLFAFTLILLLLSLFF